MLFRRFRNKIYLICVLFISLQCSTTIHNKQKRIFFVEICFVFFDKHIASVVYRLSIDLTLIHTRSRNTKHKIIFSISRNNIFRDWECSIVILLSYCKWSSSICVSKNRDVQCCLHSNSISKSDTSIPVTTWNKSFFFKDLKILSYSPFRFLMEKIFEFFYSRRFSISLNKISNNIQSMLLFFCKHNNYLIYKI